MLLGTLARRGKVTRSGAAGEEILEGVAREAHPETPAWAGKSFGARRCVNISTEVAGCNMYFQGPLESYITPKAAMVFSFVLSKAKGKLFQNGFYFLLYYILPREPQILYCTIWLCKHLDPEGSLRGF